MELGIRTSTGGSGLAWGWDGARHQDRQRRIETAPGAGADRAAGRAQAAPSSACGTWAITHSSSLPCHPEGAAHLTPARRGRSCLGGKWLQERKPRNAPTGRCRASQRREGPQGNRGGFPAPSGIHPAAAKVLVRRPSSFPGIKEPTQSGGIPRSEAKALLECRCLVPPAGGRLLQERSRGSLGRTSWAGNAGREEAGATESEPALLGLPIARGWRSCALPCPSYCQGMEELCPGAVPCTALPALPALRSSGNPARSRRTPSTARGSRDGAAPGQRFHRQPDGFVWRAGLVCQTHIPGVGTGHGHCGGHGQRAARGSSAGAALDGPPEMPHPGHAPAPAQKDPENPAGPRQCRHGGAAEQRGQPFPGPTSQSSPAPPACVPPAPNPCPSSRRPAASSSLKARAMCPQRH
ncbi:SH3 and multiple ankyrin repeat domains protein 1-like [Manacus candei]|uniref:SH3 and multiple ankyrin repeat domains protein 1-like n=1 Tax=Manacus candei TaxID=415023 RepID=UPI002227A6DE|nr:SH3 and multiple ankyrin repeat domains protein 1-like [Manacus candei]